MSAAKPVISPGGVLSRRGERAGANAWIVGGDIRTEPVADHAELDGGGLPWQPASDIARWRERLDRPPGCSGLLCECPTQINVQVPDDAALGPVQVMVTNPGGTSDPAIANMAKFALAFFTFDGTHIAATNSYKEPPADLLRHGREVVVLYGTGFGATSPPTPAGTIVSSAHPLESLSALTISGGVTAKVVFAGVTATGLSIQRESSGDVIQTGTPRWWRRSTARRPKPGR